MAATRYDVLVAGGGTAGCVLAARLSEDAGCTVCLVEAGPDYGPYARGGWPADMLDARVFPRSHEWETSRDDHSQLRARILGGCSAHNACVVLEAPPEDYDEWGAGWTHAGLAPYLDRARTALRAVPCDEDMLSPWHRAFVAAGGADTVVGAVNAVGTVRWNASFAYIDPVREHPNLTIRARTTVEHLLHRRGRVHGVLTSRGELHADTVVIAAGAYGSPGILLRSGIGPETGLPVGEGLRDHVGVSVLLEPTVDLRREREEFDRQRPAAITGQVALRIRSGGCAEPGHNLFLCPALEADQPYGVAVIAMNPRSTGRVTLSAADAATPLEINHGFLADPSDAAVIAHGIAALRELVARPPLDRCVAGELDPGSDVRGEDFVRRAIRGFFHPVGTCAIGRVVDAGGAVLGYDGLRVADASIMPTIPRANTNLTVAAIAERVAELVRTGGRTDVG